jgi:hypothetical protein
MRKWVVQALAPLLGAALLLVGVLALGRGSWEHLRGLPRYTAAFADIECTPPPGLSREDFLGEVQYLVGLADGLDLLDSGLAERLAGAFARHPWVERVEQVEVVPPGQVRVRLVYRTPVLVVARNGEREEGPPSPLRRGPCPARAVDRHGVLLPRSGAQPELPLLVGDFEAPGGPPGIPWGDVRIESAAATAWVLLPSLAVLGLDRCRLEFVGDELVLSKPGVRVLWGRAPGREQPGEAAAAVKVQHLLDYRAQHEGLEGQEHDVRPAEQPLHAPLAEGEPP